jgi:hypothetical protein
MPTHYHIKQISANGVSRRLVAVLLALIVVSSCKDPYISPYKNPTTGYLVVEGFISGNSVTTFSLTRTIPLPGDSTIPTVDGATVEVEGSDNSVYPLTDTGHGVYSSIDTLNLNPQLTYRLNIKTPNGEQYQSDLVQYISNPPIDSVNWVQNADRSINIYVNTHDPTNNVKYYQWEYEQTYEYHSAEESFDIWDQDTTYPYPIARTPAQEIYTCWQSAGSTNLLLANTSKLSAAVVYRQPVKEIPPDDPQTSVLYSILVTQYGLTADGYNFLSLMQQNTESLGSIFDAQPTQLTGNIHCVTTPTEQVIGWVSAGVVQSERIWIYRYRFFQRSGTGTIFWRGDLYPPVSGPCLVEGQLYRLYQLSRPGRNHCETVVLAQRLLISCVEPTISPPD